MRSSRGLVRSDLASILTSKLVALGLLASILLETAMATHFRYKVSKLHMLRDYFQNLRIIVFIKCTKEQIFKYKGPNIQ
jgi:hypothetical protein